jgi:hypothetical protein
VAAFLQHAQLKEVMSVSPEIMDVIGGF